MSAPRWGGRRNAAAAAATGGALVALLLYPSSTSGRTGSISTPATDGSSQATVTRGGDGVLVVDGPVVETVYGPLQVQIRYRDGRIELATATTYPQSTLVDKAINGNAIPALRDQVLIEQSAQIDTVSGATQTSEAYRTSLQAALDAADAAPPVDPSADAGHGGHSGE